MNEQFVEKPTKFDYLSYAEKELFPNVAYHALTLEQREKSYDFAKAMVLAMTGRKIA